MIEDIVTMMWKEWREVILNRRGMRGGLINIGVVVLILGIFMPLQAGRAWLTDPKQLLIWSWLPIFIALSIVTDAIAGERERQTLETLLATRLSDQAILFGKIITVVLYAWLLTVISILIGAVAVNIAFPTDSIQFYAFDGLVIALVISLLAAVLIACIGVLVSLRAPSARQAYQRMSVVLLAFWFLPMLLMQILPEEAMGRVLGFLSRIDLNQAVLYLGMGLFAADLVLLFVVNKVFKRNRLILD